MPFTDEEVRVLARNLGSANPPPLSPRDQEILAAVFLAARVPVRLATAETAEAEAEAEAELLLINLREQLASSYEDEDEDNPVEICMYGKIHPPPDP
jgi:hypothetical protein